MSSRRRYHSGLEASLCLYRKSHEHGVFGRWNQRIWRYGVVVQPSIEAPDLDEYQLLSSRYAGCEACDLV